MDSEVSALDLTFNTPFVRGEVSEMMMTFNFSHILGAIAPPSGPTFNLTVLASEVDLRGVENYTVLDTLYVFDSSELDLNFQFEPDMVLFFNETIVVTLLLDYCLNVSYVCIHMSASDMANYIEIDETNNVECFDVTDILVCQPGRLT